MAVLFAPAEFWRLSAEDRAACCNGCGTKGLGGWIVPNTLYGLSAEDVCNIHNYEYKVGETIEDKRRADRIMLNNMLRLIQAASKRGSWVDTMLAPLRRRRALKYYEAVYYGGGPAFWKGKNAASEQARIPVKRAMS